MRKKIVPSLSRLKLKFWPHEGVNLHSRDIRKAEGDFACMQLSGTRESMYSEITRFMSQDYTLFISCIHKERHLANYGRHAVNPYELALGMTLEHVMHFMDGCGADALPIVAESRGENEDNQLAAAFRKLTGDRVGRQTAESAKEKQLRLSFRKKRDNIAGLQMADLAAYPYARKILGSDRFDRQIEVLSPHIYQREGVSGLKVFP